MCSNVSENTSKIFSFFVFAFQKLCFRTFSKTPCIFCMWHHPENVKAQEYFPPIWHVLHIYLNTFEAVNDTFFFAFTSGNFGVYFILITLFWNKHGLVGLWSWKIYALLCNQVSVSISIGHSVGATIQEAFTHVLRCTGWGPLKGAIRVCHMCTRLNPSSHVVHSWVFLVPSLLLFFLVVPMCTQLLTHTAN